MVAGAWAGRIGFGGLYYGIAIASRLLYHDLCAHLHSCAYDMLPWPGMTVHLIVESREKHVHGRV